MTEHVTKFRVFIGSPGDVVDERESLKEVIEELNQTIGDERGVAIELVRWETHVSPDMGRPQQIVNDQIGDYDIFIGIMWKRFGSPTGFAESGTEEEFQRAYELWQAAARPRIMFYFSQQAFMPRSVEELRQCEKVLDFRAQISLAGIVSEYRGPKEFPGLVRKHLYKVIASISSQVAPTTERVDSLGVLFEDDFQEFEGWETLGEGIVVQSGENVHSGEHSLKKKGAADPNGGYKLLKHSVGSGFALTGWIYHPSQRSGAPADRLAVEDNQFNGYGFCITDSCTRMWIERRDRLTPVTIGEQRTVSLSTDTWYRFAFYVRGDNTLGIYIYDDLGKEIEKIDGVRDQRYKEFDRVAVHGGAHYYVDELRISRVT